MKLLAREDDYCSLKIKICAKLVDVDISVTNISESSLTLTTNDGNNITQHLTALRYVADMKPVSQLHGVSEIDIAKVDQWLELTWQDVEVPLQLLLSIDAGNPANVVGAEEKAKIIEKAKSDLSKMLNTLESTMSSRTFLIGERVTIADISLFCAYGTAIKKGYNNLSAFPSCKRWFLTVANLSGISDLVKSIADVINDQKVESSNVGGKWRRSRIRVKELLAMGESAIGTDVTVKGWVRTSRSAEKGKLFFVELTDGSTVRGIQLVHEEGKTIGIESVVNSGGVGASISATGTVVPSQGKGQSVEILVKVAECIGPVYGGDKGEIGGKNYPMAKKAHSLEYLREKAHLRPRSKMFSSALRMRHAMAFATHKFFNERGFVYTHTPLITGSDCEGAGEQFTVTTLLPDHVMLKDIPVDKSGKVDFSKDFFSRKCSMTVSGQLNVETHACALSDVYTFGPTFRAENSHTARHLAEFWMIEPEICFATLADDMALAEDYVRYCAKYALENCADDLYYFEHEYPQGEKGLSARLQNVVESDFAQITYTEAVELLQKEIASGAVQFEKYPNWGDDLGSEHERYITEKIFKKPTIVINYPKGIKAFYMKLNDDNETVAAMDILVPKIGELIGGSQREDKLDILESRCRAIGLNPEDLWWYLDLRRYGSVPHAGFGLGFERLIMFVTGLENIRDVISFPRVPGHADF